MRILLQFTCSKTSGLPSICGDPAKPTRSSLYTTSDTHIPGFVVSSSLSVVFHVSVEFSCVEVFRVLLDVPSLEEFSIRCQSLFFPLPPRPPTLESMDPLRFIRNPSLAQSQSSSQLFGFTNATPNVFAIHTDLKKIPHYRFLAEHYSKWQPKLRGLHNTLKNAG